MGQGRRAENRGYVLCGLKAGSCTVQTPAPRAAQLVLTVLGWGLGSLPSASGWTHLQKAHALPSASSHSVACDGAPWMRCQLTAYAENAARLTPSPLCCVYMPHTAAVQVALRITASFFCCVQRQVLVGRQAREMNLVLHGLCSGNRTERTKTIM